MVTEGKLFCGGATQVRKSGIHLVVAIVIIINVVIVVVVIIIIVVVIVIVVVVVIIVFAGRQATIDLDGLMGFRGDG